jgi:hypothetical protein
MHCIFFWNEFYAFASSDLNRSHKVNNCDLTFSFISGSGLIFMVFMCYRFGHEIEGYGTDCLTTGTVPVHVWHDYLFLDALPLEWPPLKGEVVVADDSENEDPISSCRSLDLAQLILDTINNNSGALDLEDFDSLSNDDVKNVCADLFRGKDTH